jgi:ElaB/YqjD/DUF883 family membrane-anchored ribosome-binding protein
MRIRQARNPEQIANEIEPLAQSLATLADETRQTLADLKKALLEAEIRHKAEIETLSNDLERKTGAAMNSYREAAQEAQKAANSLNQAGQRMEWRFLAMLTAVGALTGVLVSVFWLYLAPPSIQNTLNPEAVAERLKPAILEALKPPAPEPKRR